MNDWPWWVSGLALAGVMVFHSLATGRLMAVSGRFTALVNRLRFGPPKAPDLQDQELLAALRAMTAEEFGPESLYADAVITTDLPAEPRVDPPVQTAKLGTRRTTREHVVFLGALAVGGLCGAVWRGSFAFTPGLRSVQLPTLFGQGPALVSVLLLIGGVLVGFGTRMAGGCTSGHGMCGVSRFQPGSLAATAVFFSTAIGVSLTWSWL